jgi:radical SAM protein with 4Fe4S-binding SPASM domain
MGLEMSSTRPRLRVRYEVGYEYCDFRCPYCIIGWNSERKKTEWEWDATNFNTICRNLQELPYLLNIRLAVFGEIFTSDQLIQGAVALTRSPNVEAINIVTNLAVPFERLRRFLDEADKTKLALACTLHDMQTDLNGYLPKLEFLKQEGVSVIAGYVAYPQQFDRVRKYKKMFDERDIPLYVNPFNGTFKGKRYPASYTQEEKDELKSLMFSGHEYRYMLCKEVPYGKLCTAGKDYIYIAPNGEVYRCGKMKVRGDKPIGNMLEGRLELFDRYHRCAAESCFCTVENINLVEFEKVYQRTKHFRIFHQKAGVPDSRRCGTSQKLSAVPRVLFSPFFWRHQSALVVRRIVRKMRGQQPGQEIVFLD